MYVPDDMSSDFVVEASADWSGLNSSRLATSESDLKLLSSYPEKWIGIEFTPRGTPTPAVSVGNQIVLASGRRNPSVDSSPVIYLNPDNVRGLIVSNYGLTRLVNDYEGFK